MFFHHWTLGKTDTTEWSWLYGFLAMEADIPWRALGPRTTICLERIGVTLHCIRWFGIWFKKVGPCCVGCWKKKRAGSMTRWLKNWSARRKNWSKVYVASLVLVRMSSPVRNYSLWSPMDIIYGKREIFSSIYFKVSFCLWLLVKFVSKWGFPKIYSVQLDKSPT